MNAIRMISAVALLLAASPGWAQMKDPSPGNMGMMGGAMGMPMMMEAHDRGMGMEMGGEMMKMDRMMKALSRLELAPDQKKKLQALKLRHQKEAIPLLARVRLAGVEVEELLLADSIDMKKVKAKVKEKYEALADLDISHIELKQQMKALLTPEQRERLDAMMMGMGPMMGSQSGAAEPGKTPEPGTGAPGEQSGGAADPHGH